MISYNFENDFTIQNESNFNNWIESVVISESKTVGELNFIFCNDDYLLDINNQFLDHDYYTDIITFDYCVGNELSGDIFISTQRVQENSSEFSVTFDNELLRVISHGVLHLCGYKDKNSEDIEEMRRKENEKIELFHVEQ